MFSRILLVAEEMIALQFLSDENKASLSDENKASHQLTSEVLAKRGFEQVRCSTSIPSASYRKGDFTGTTEESLPYCR